MNDRILKNKLEATEYLQRRGYKVGKSKVYADAKRGLVRIQEDGTILAADVEAYARAANLQRPDLDGPDPADVEAVQKEKTELEKEELQLKVEKRRYELEKDQGKHVPREKLELALASRAGVFYSGMQTEFNGHGRDLVHAAGGSSEYVPDLVGMLMDILDKKMNEFSRMDRFLVIFESDEQVDE